MFPPPALAERLRYLVIEFTASGDTGEEDSKSNPTPDLEETN
jgi:hypothetical protein